MRRLRGDRAAAGAMAETGAFPWDKLLSIVRRDHPDRYRRWFEELEPPQLGGGELRVRVDDVTRANYLRQNCGEAFSSAAIALSGRLLSVRFIDPESEHQIRSNGNGYPERIPLDADYTFDQFVVGISNRLAHAACRAVCGQPGTLYNPLFIHGPSGLGKSHLLQAVCAELTDATPPRDVLYLSCDSFVNGFVHAIETGSLEQFRETARRADVLVIDDVQFLANRESSQEEIFHTFNVLYQANRQIVLSADSAPAEIPTLEDRLVSRFNWGLVTQIDVPNRETRQAILQKKVRLRGAEIPADVLDFVAERVQSNVRVLEGALTKLISDCQVTGMPMTVSSAREILAGFDGPPHRPLQISGILETVSNHFGVRLAELVGRKRSRSISFPRQIAMYLARELTPLSLEEIGGHFGGRDHSTVLHAERVIAQSREADTRTAETLTQLKKELLAGH